MNINLLGDLPEVVSQIVGCIKELDEKWYVDALEFLDGETGVNPETHSLIQLLCQANQFFRLEIENRAMPNTSLTAEIRKLGRQMQYPTPAVWLSYKLLAYQMETEPIKTALSGGIVTRIMTWGDLVNHCSVDGGYVCGKRLHFLHLRMDELAGRRNPGLIQMFMVARDHRGRTMSRYPEIMGSGGLYQNDTDLLFVLNNPEFQTVSSDPETLETWLAHEPFKWFGYNM